MHHTSSDTGKNPHTDKQFTECVGRDVVQEEALFQSPGNGIETEPEFDKIMQKAIAKTPIMSPRPDKSGSRSRTCRIIDVEFSPLGIPSVCWTPGKRDKFSMTKCIS
jgi:hypothetical protein